MRLEISMLDFRIKFTILHISHKFLNNEFLLYISQMISHLLGLVYHKDWNVTHQLILKYQSYEVSGHYVLINEGLESVLTLYVFMLEVAL